MVSDWLWYQAHTVIDRRCTRLHPKRGAEHPLAGKPRDSRKLLSTLFVCGICGGPMHAEGRNEGGYRCANSKRYACWNRATCLRDQAHPAILGKVVDALMSMAGVRDRLVARVQELHATGGDIAAERQSLESEGRRLAASIENIGAREQRLAVLARRSDVRTAIDTLVAVEAVSAAARSAWATIGVLVDLDVGRGRTGVPTAESLLAIAQAVAAAPGLRLDGIFCYPGHIWAKPAEQAAPLAAVAAKLQEAIDLFDRNGLCREVVSGGSTPTAFQSHLVPQFTEIRPGTYVFNDMNTLHGGFCSLDECAARIVCTVVSDAVTGQFVLDGGTKTFTGDRCGPAPDSGRGWASG